MSFIWTPIVDGLSGTEISGGALNALAAKVGDDTSAVVTSLDYLLKNPASIEPGHKHNKLWASDGSPEAVTVDAAGKVGILEGTPLAPLHVSGTAGTWGKMAVTGTDYNCHFFYGTNEDSYIRSGKSSGVVAIQDTGGNVGIGTTNPTISGIGKLHLAGDTLRLDTARTPASAGAAGNAGEICWDSSYIYVCMATNSWKRAAIAAW